MATTDAGEAWDALVAPVGGPDTDPEPQPEPETESDDETEPEVDPRRCDLCQEPGTTDALPMHGECIIREEFGGIGEILTAEDVGSSTDADGGLTIRQSGQAVEILIAHTTADRVLRRAFVSDLFDEDTIEERRKMRAYFVAVVAGDFGPLDACDPVLGARLRVREAMGTLRDTLSVRADKPAEADS